MLAARTPDAVPNHPGSTNVQRAANVPPSHCVPCLPPLGLVWPSPSPTTTQPYPVVTRPPPNSRFATPPLTPTLTEDGPTPLPSHHASLSVSWSRPLVTLSVAPSNFSLPATNPNPRTQHNLRHDPPPPSNPQPTITPSRCASPTVLENPFTSFNTTSPLPHTTYPLIPTIVPPSPASRKEN